MEESTIVPHFVVERKICDAIVIGYRKGVLLAYRRVSIPTIIRIDDKHSDEVSIVLISQLMHDSHVCIGSLP